MKKYLLLKKLTKTLVLSVMFFATTITAQNWQQISADIDGEVAGDYSGYSVSLSADGTILAIGAPYNDGNGSDAGQVRVYKNNGTAWVQQGADINGEAAGNLFGTSVSLNADGSVLAIGARWNSGNGTISGHVRVFNYSGTAWVQQGVDINGETAGDESGYSVSLSADGTILAIGALENSGNGNSAGQVRVYKYNSTTWVQQGADIDGEAAFDNSGRSVSLNADGTVLAIGGDSNDGNGSDAGHVRVYKYSVSS